jgi:flagellar biosynthesis protein FlhF
VRIKRFIAPDMRTALRMVRQEQGPDAVILSNRPTVGGIEVVAATDYDESLVQQALRAAVPALQPVATTDACPPPVRIAAPQGATAERRLVRETDEAPQPVAVISRADAMIAALSPMGAPPARESVAARARSKCGIGDATTAAVARPVEARVAQPAPRPLPTTEHAADAIAKTHSPSDEFRALLARLTAVEESDPPVAAMRGDVAVHDTATAQSPVANVSMESQSDARTAEIPGCPDAMEGVVACDQAAGPDPDAAASPVLADIEAPALRAVASESPALAAMRAELATMRRLMEKQMGELSIERLRGSPARAAVFDALLGYGCDEGMAELVAARIDPRLEPGQARALMLEELSRLIVCNRSEPIDEGGVIALVGPTGAGKTTTAAKLAAAFAARHRARDVALVSTDTQRAGAREQLQAHGRRLGITVCEAEGPEALGQTLEQLLDYPLVLVDTAGYAVRDRALLGQILWLRSARRVRSLLVLPANANPHDLAEIARRYRPAEPEGVVLTKVDETGRLGAALSVLRRQNLSLAYTSSGQHVPTDLHAADPMRLVQALEKLRRAADNPLATEDRHAVA